MRCILILSSHLRSGLPNGLFHSGFPTEILYAFVVRGICPVRLILLDLIALIIFNKESALKFS